MKLVGRKVETLCAGTATGVLNRVSVLDLEPSHVFVPVLLCFESTPDPERLRRSMVRVLRHFPELAGRLVVHEGAVHIACSDQGVRFEHARRGGPMPAYGPTYTAQRDFRSLLARKGFAKPGRDQPLVDVCLTQFECGGAVLGVAVCHTLVDGTALFAFLRAWAAELKGADYAIPTQSRERVEALGEVRGSDPSSHPRYTELSRWAFAKFVARFLWEGRQLEHTVVRFDAARLAAMKRDANERLALLGDNWVSTNDVLGAHLWSAFLKLQPRSRSTLETLTLIQSMRGLVDPPFEAHYMGNCATNTSVRGPNSALADSSPPELALRIRKAYAENDEPRVRRLIAFLCAQRRRGKFSRTMFNDVPALFRGHTLMLNDWSKFPIYSLDFGSGTPVWFEIPAPPLPSFMLLAPAPEPGARDVHVVLNKRTIGNFVAALG